MRQLKRSLNYVPHKNMSEGDDTPRLCDSSGAMGSRMKIAVMTAAAVATCRPSPVGPTLSWMYFSASRWQMRTYRPKGRASELPSSPRPRPAGEKERVVIHQSIVG